MKARQHKARKNGKIKSNAWNIIKEFYDYCCLCCGKQEPEIKLTKDHVIPLCKGGPNDIYNIQPLCESCNNVKSNKITDYRKQYLDPLAILQIEGLVKQNQ